MDRTTPPAIHVAGLGRDFGDRSAVHQLDLQVNAGEVYGLLGPNGSGKSTTVRMLTTMLRPSRGTAHVAGADITRDPETVRRRIGIVLQETALDPLMSARELLHLQGRLQSFTARQARDRGAELLVSFSMKEFADTPVSRLSGGQRRRVDLAVALVQRPLVLFLDEPTTGLDPVSRRRLWEEIRTLSASHHVTVLLTTQYLEEADQLCDRVGILREGRLVTSAAPHALKAEAGDRVLTLRFRDADTTSHALQLLTGRGEQATLTGPDARALSARLAHPGADGKILLALASAGLHADSLSVDEPSLEDVFLRLATAPKGESAA
ncbi:ATP-binding cassette domain-containing protein [Streptosporangium sp. NPDC005286]|uniref:ATP-binding cassette domain-containing protein n=1 Tax=Streptosporangium sp. NPDC005286 TaxID=3154463 RepID=UPI0033B71A49